MKYPIKLLLGIVYILAKYIMLTIFSIFLFIWDLDIDLIKELWLDTKPFYIHTVFQTEDYRYNTLLDFINNNKNYSHSKFKL